MLDETTPSPSYIFNFSVFIWIVSRSEYCLIFVGAEHLEKKHTNNKKSQHKQILKDKQIVNHKAGSVLN